MRRLLAVLVAGLLAMAPAHTSAAGASWEEWKPISGIFDVDGPRTDGSLIVAGSAALFLADPAGAVTPFARGPGAGEWGLPAIAFLLLVALVGAVGLQAAVRRRRR